MGVASVFLLVTIVSVSVAMAALLEPRVIVGTVVVMNGFFSAAHEFISRANLAIWVKV